MANVDILAVFNQDAFIPNTPNWLNPDGSNSYKYSNSQSVRMLSFSNQVVSGNGDWNLSIRVQQGDTVRWLDTTGVQGENNTDMVVYGLYIPNPTEWNKYLSPLVGDEFNSLTCHQSNEFGTIPPKFQSMSGPSNFMSTTVTTAPSQAVTLNYYLRVAKLQVVSGSVNVIGTYGIDPTITITP